MDITVFSSCTCCMSSFIDKCWCSSINKKDEPLSIRPYLLSLVGMNINLYSFIRSWVEPDQVQSVLDYLSRSYEDVNEDMNPIMLGIICDQASKLNLSEFKGLPSMLLLNHLSEGIEEAVDLIGFYLYLARCRRKAATSPDFIEHMWRPFSMGIDNFPIVEVMNEQGIYIPSKRSMRFMYRWTDSSMPNRLLSISESLITLYRMKNLLKGLTHTSFYKYRFN